MKTMRKTCIVFLSTFPPRECGIATFTDDLATAFGDLFSPIKEARIVAINPTELNSYNYPKSVITRIAQEKKGDYVEAAKKLNKMEQVKIICIQHEFGIYGGGSGSNLLYFLREIKKPVVITMHTILPATNPYYKKHQKVISAINDYVRSIVVMIDNSKEILVDDYGIDPGKIKIIPHGIHANPYQDTREAKKVLKLKGKTVISTFGMLNRGKGIEYVIRSMPEIIKKHPNITYLIIGATHPVILKKEGEAYRKELEKLVKKLGLSNNVIFFNSYFPTKKIIDFLSATDIYLSVSLDPNQAVSGTLSYALGAGRPVVSTAFPQAKEYVTNKIGRIVEFRDSPAITRAILDILSNDARLIKMSKCAYFRTRRMTWENVALSYMREFIAIVPELGLYEKNLPKIKLQHFKKLTDDFGMFQFANLTTPDSNSGYTLDDNARALIAVTRYREKYSDSTSLKLANVYLNFLEYIFKQPGCQNYINHGKDFNTERNESEGLDDAYARGIYALAVVAASRSMPTTIRKRAAKIFMKKFDLDKLVRAPRAASFYIKALCEWIGYDNDVKYIDILKKYCNYLVGLYKKTSEPGWQWFEDILTYSNGVMPEALLLAYKKLGYQQYFNVSKSTLDFLIMHSFKGDTFVPIGQSGWFKRGGEKTIYDQQPEEVSAFVLALQAMYEVSSDEKYRKLTYRAFDWYLGNNLLGQVVYNHATGGCYDGIGEKEINLNQGAESTVMYLIARLAIERNNKVK